MDSDEETGDAMQLLTVLHAGRVLGVSPARVVQLANRGRLPHVRDSTGRRLFRPEDVETLRIEREGQRSHRGSGNGAQK